MKKSDFETTLIGFYINMITDANFLIKIARAKSVVKSLEEKRSVFEAFVFSICANWEILVEDLLIDCLNKDTSQYRKYTGFKIPPHITRETCKAIIIETGYLDFKGINDLKAKTRNILVPQFNPFDKIPRVNREKIEEFFAMRNYIAHYSYASKRRLEKIYRNRYKLKTFRWPGEFLLAKDKIKGIPRMDFFINNFLKTADIIAEHCGVDIKTEDFTK